MRPGLIVDRSSREVRMELAVVDGAWSILHSLPPVEMRFSSVRTSEAYSTEKRVVFGENRLERESKIYLPSICFASKISLECVITTSYFP